MLSSCGKLTFITKNDGENEKKGEIDAIAGIFAINANNRSVLCIAVAKYLRITSRLTPCFTTREGGK